MLYLLQAYIDLFQSEGFGAATVMKEEATNGVEGKPQPLRMDHDFQAFNGGFAVIAIVVHVTRGSVQQALLLVVAYC